MFSSSSSSSAAAGQQQQHYWNREISQPCGYDSTVPVVRTAKIVSLTDDADDPACRPLHASLLEEGKGGVGMSPSFPDGAQLLRIGTEFTDDELLALKGEGANVVFCVNYGPQAADHLERLLSVVGDQIQWIHARNAGIDFCASQALRRWQKDGGGTMTNAKGCFSSTLAEATMLACGYFAKDLPRLLRNHADGRWEKYDVLELRGATLGVVGLGDIGRACARLARAYGMRVVGLTKRSRSTADGETLPCDVLYSSDDDPDALNRVFSESDYVVCSLPLTKDTEGMVGREQFDSAKPGRTVLINVGRGPCVDEAALVEALRSGQLKGAGLDVFEQEPLPDDSPLWKMTDRVLLSPHNMDQTATFMEEATEMFVNENVPRFVRDLPLLNPVDVEAGY